MTREEIIKGLEQESLLSRKGLFSEAAEMIRTEATAIETLAKWIAGESYWKIPLSDGVMAEVKICGKHSIDHVRVFAAIFSVIAENYKAPLARTEEWSAKPQCREERQRRAIHTFLFLQESLELR